MYNKDIANEHGNSIKRLESIHAETGRQACPHHALMINQKCDN